MEASAAGQGAADGGWQASHSCSSQAAANDVLWWEAALLQENAAIQAQQQHNLNAHAAAAMQLQAGAWPWHASMIDAYVSDFSAWWGYASAAASPTDGMLQGSPTNYVGMQPPGLG